MLHVFGFERLGVVVADLYFVNPRLEPDQAGPEQGVRVEVRVLDRGEPPGSVYSALPIAIGRPIWRADLLESVDRPATLDRAHHHPRFDGWEPGPRRFDEAMTADPVRWVRERLADPGALLAGAGVAMDEVEPEDIDGMAGAAAEIMAAIERLLVRARVRGRAARPEPTPGHGVREGWL